MDAHPMGIPAKADPRKDAIRLSGLVLPRNVRNKAGVTGKGWLSNGCEIVAD